jgi:hypothetical protein
MDDQELNALLEEFRAATIGMRDTLLGTSGEISQINNNLNSSKGDLQNNFRQISVNLGMLASTQGRTAAILNNFNKSLTDVKTVFDMFVTSLDAKRLDPFFNDILASTTTFKSKLENITFDTSSVNRSIGDIQSSIDNFNNLIKGFELPAIGSIDTSGLTESIGKIQTDLEEFKGKIASLALPKIKSIDTSGLNASILETKNAFDLFRNQLALFKLPELKTTVKGDTTLEAVDQHTKEKTIPLREEEEKLTKEKTIPLQKEYNNQVEALIDIFGDLQAKLVEITGATTSAASPVNDLRSNQRKGLLEKDIDLNDVLEKAKVEGRSTVKLDNDQLAKLNELGLTKAERQSLKIPRGAEQIGKGAEVDTDKLEKVLERIERQKNLDLEGFQYASKRINSLGEASSKLSEQFLETNKQNIGLSATTQLLTAAISGSVLAIKSYTSAIYEGRRGAMVSAEATTKFADTLGSAAQGIGFALMLIPGLGLAARFAGGALALFGTTAKAGAKLNELASKQGEDLYKSFNELGKVSGTTSGGFENIFRNQQKLGISTEQYTSLITNNAKEMKLFGASVGDGADKFVSVASSITSPTNELGKSLLRLGITTEEQNEHIVQYMAAEAKRGTLANKSQADLTKGAYAYMEELDKLAAITGATRKEQEEARKAIQSISELRAAQVEAEASGDFEKAARLKKAEDIATQLQAKGLTNLAAGAARYYAAGGAVDKNSAAYQTMMGQGGLQAVEKQDTAQAMLTVGEQLTKQQKIYAGGVKIDSGIFTSLFGDTFAAANDFTRAQEGLRRTVKEKTGKDDAETIAKFVEDQREAQKRGEKLDPNVEKYIGAVENDRQSQAKLQAMVFTQLGAAIERYATNASQFNSGVDKFSTAVDTFRDWIKDKTGIELDSNKLLDWSYAGIAIAGVLTTVLSKKLLKPLGDAAGKLGSTLSENTAATAGNATKAVSTAATGIGTPRWTGDSIKRQARDADNAAFLKTFKETRGSIRYRNRASTEAGKAARKKFFEDLRAAKAGEGIAGNLPTTSAKGMDNLSSLSERTGPSFGSKITDLGKGLGGFIQGIGAGAGGAIQGILQGIAGGLTAFANPLILKGAAIFSGAIALISAGAAASMWLIGKALPTFAEGVAAFSGIDGDNLVDVGLGITALGGGLAVFAAGGVAASFANVASSIVDGLVGFFGGKTPFEKIADFSNLPIDGPKLKTNAEALLAFGEAMAALSNGSASITGAIAEKLFSIFDVKTPWDRFVEFSKLPIDDSAKVKNNAEALRAFAEGLSALKSGITISGVLAEGLANFFEVKTPWDRFVEFSKLPIENAPKVKTNAEALRAFAEAMSKLKGGTTISIGIAEGLSKFFEVKTPWDRFIDFSKLELGDTDKITKNANALKAFNDAMSGYKGGSISNWLGNFDSLNVDFEALAKRINSFIKSFENQKIDSSKKDIIISNADILKAFDSAIGEYKGAGAGVGTWLNNFDSLNVDFEALAKRIKSFIDEFAQFSPNSKEKIIVNADILKTFDQALSSYQGAGAGAGAWLNNFDFLNVDLASLKKKIETFNSINVSKEIVTRNAEALAAFDQALSSYQGAGTGSSTLLSKIADFFGAGINIDDLAKKLLKFSEIKITGSIEDFKTKAEGFKAFAEGMEAFSNVKAVKGSTLANTISDNLSKKFDGKTITEKFEEFANLKIDPLKFKQNNEAFNTFLSSMGMKGAVDLGVAKETAAAQSRMKELGGLPAATQGGNAAAGLGATPNATKAMEFFIKQGWTREQAAGIVGNLQQESGKDLSTTAFNKKENAQGIAQWRNDRLERFRQMYGKEVKSATLEEQLAYVDWELKNTEKQAGDSLRQTRTAEDAAAVVDKKYERSAGTEVANRKNNALALLGSSPATPSVASAASSITSSEEMLRAAGLKIKQGDVQAPNASLDSRMIGLAQQIQSSIPGFHAFTGFNDRFHIRETPNSMHTQGKAVDFTLTKPPTVEEGKQIVAALKQMGFSGAIDEYNNPSRNATGGHIHAQLDGSISAPTSPAQPTGSTAVASAASPANSRKKPTTAAQAFADEYRAQFGSIPADINKPVTVPEPKVASAPTTAPTTAPIVAPTPPTEPPQATAAGVQMARAPAPMNIANEQKLSQGDMSGVTALSGKLDQLISAVNAQARPDDSSNLKMGGEILSKLDEVIDLLERSTRLQGKSLDYARA